MRVLKIQTEQVLGKSSVVYLVWLVDDEIDQIESVCQRWLDSTSLYNDCLNCMPYLDSKVGGRSMFCGTEMEQSHLDFIGFAQARIDVLAFSVVMMPAFATDTVCCSCKRALAAVRVA